MGKEFFSSGEAARELGISRSWLKELTLLETGTPPTMGSRGDWVYNAVLLEKVRKLMHVKRRLMKRR